jgi:hypothetical protein
MAKAYRSDIVRQKRFQDAITQLVDPLAPQSVVCPVTGCECLYRIYDYVLADAENNQALLEDRLRREHPDHYNEIIVIGESA